MTTKLTDAQKAFLRAVKPEQTIHIGNPWSHPYVHGQRISTPELVLRLIGLRVLEFVPNETVRLRYTRKGLRLRERVLDEIPSVNQMLIAPGLFGL